MITLEMKSIENHFDNQEKIIDNLKDIIQSKENENVRLWHENRKLKQIINEIGGNINE